MKRRDFVVLLWAAAVPAALRAQPRRPKIGVLLAVPRVQSILLPGVMQRLAELGFAEGKEATFEFRSADSRPERYPELARELIRAQCNLIFAIGPEHGPIALRDARTTIPVVFFANDYDPLEKGIIKSLARPESSITGVYVPQLEMVAKRFQVLREAFPTLGEFSSSLTPSRAIS